MGMGLLALLAVLGGSGCSNVQKPAADPTFQNDLVRQLGAAKSVRITEQSSPYDRGGRVSREHLYREKILTPESKARLMAKLSAMDPALPQSAAACIQLNHHRIEFPGTNVPPVEICFHCSQLDWAGTKGRHPAAIFRVLGDFLESEGFERSRDWDKLAEEAEKKAAR
jgi:hypothetical protein